MSRDTAYEEKYMARHFYAAVVKASERLGEAWEGADVEARRRAVSAAFVEWIAGASLGGLDGSVMLRVIKLTAEAITTAEWFELVDEDATP
jgi:hypothetical protein